jgi:citrate lyase subunit beta/citryl-CoA lyase
MTHQRTQSDEQGNGGSRIRQVRAASAAALGHNGKRVLHPTQIEAANQAFAPSEADYSRATRTIEAYSHATAARSCSAAR